MAKLNGLLSILMAAIIIITTQMLIIEGNEIRDSSLSHTALQRVKSREKRDDSDVNMALWLGPRLGRKRRSALDTGNDMNLEDYNLKFLPLDERSLKFMLKYPFAIVPDDDDSVFYRSKRY